MLYISTLTTNTQASVALLASEALPYSGSKTMKIRENIMKLLLSLLTAIIFTGCSAIDVKEYRGNHPKFDLFAYFLGETTGWGIVQDRNGRLLRQFVVHIQGTISNQEELTLQEYFTWSDGEISDRTWILRKETENTFSGVANDVVGYAYGEAYGNAVNWKYNLDVKVDDATYTLHLDDWMFLQPNGVLINTTKMSKYGFHVGDITIFFTKEKQIEEVTL